MIADQYISDIANLPIPEQIRVLQAVWDALPIDTSVPTHHEAKTELDLRMQRYRDNPDSAMSVSELRGRLKSEHGE